MITFVQNKLDQEGRRAMKKCRFHAFEQRSTDTVRRRAMKILLYFFMKIANCFVCFFEVSLIFAFFH